MTTGMLMQLTSHCTNKDSIKACHVKIIQTTQLIPKKCNI